MQARLDDPRHHPRPARRARAPPVLGDVPGPPARASKAWSSKATASPSPPTRPSASIPRRPVEGRVRFDLDLARVPTREGWTVAGRAAGDVELTGTRMRPRAYGTVQVTNVEVRDVDSTLLTLADGQIDVAGDAATIPGLRATVPGRVPRAGGPRAPGRAAAGARGARARPRGQRPHPGPPAVRRRPRAAHGAAALARRRPRGRRRRADRPAGAPARVRRDHADRRLRRASRGAAAADRRRADRAGRRRGADPRPPRDHRRRRPRPRGPHPRRARSSPPPARSASASPPAARPTCTRRSPASRPRRCWRSCGRTGRRGSRRCSPARRASWERSPRGARRTAR